MTEIPHAVLSERFHDIVRGRALRAAAFLTFELDPGFFEQEVLPAFFDVALSHPPELKLLELEDVLRKVEAVAVYYDRAALIAGAQSSRLDIQRVPVSQPRGYFHPKVVLALLGDALVVGILSANLTRSGWWENVEVAHIVEVTPGDPCSFRDDLLALIRRTRSLARNVERHQALDLIERFLRAVPAEAQRMRGGIVLPRLFFGDAPLPAWLDEIAGARLRRCNLEIVSPFFDQIHSMLPLEELRDRFRPPETRIVLPRTAEQEALCAENYYDRVKEVATWGRLPAEIMRPSKGVDRHLHAKVYRFFSSRDRYEAFFIGSANLTNAAFKRGGNIECGFFIEEERRRKPEWWITVDEHRPSVFVQRNEDDSAADGTGWKLSVRYHWREERASVLWDDGSDSPPLRLLSHGTQVAVVEPLVPREWRDLAYAEARHLATALRSGAFLTVRIEGQADAQILVEEVEMTHKPSLMSTITAADILRYWSLLTPDQKKEFLEEHAGQLAGDPEIALWLGEARNRGAKDTFFSTFAEVYLSFGNQERAVRQALEAGREREAIDRLFGRRFDSLRRLIEQVLNEGDTDAVRAYVTLLCAIQTLTALERTEPNFMNARRADVRELRAALCETTSVRERFCFGDADERDRFFAWFDRWFLVKAAPKEAQPA